MIDKHTQQETFEKRSILFKVKKGDNFNHPREIGFAPVESAAHSTG
jgi:hypothetical protein